MIGLLALLIGYLLVCAGGRQLLRLIRRNDLVFLHLRASQTTTAVTLAIAGFLCAILLGVTLLLAASRFSAAQTGNLLPETALPPLWWILLLVSVLITLILLLVHYTESDLIQFGAFCLIALVLLFALFTAFELDTPYSGLVRLPAVSGG